MHGVFGHVFRRAASRRREDFPPRPVCISLAASPQLCPLSSPPPFRQIHFSLSRVHVVILPRFRHYASLCIYFYVILIPALRCSVYSRPDYFATACIPSQRLACAEMLSQLPLSLQGTLSVVLLTLIFILFCLARMSCREHSAAEGSAAEPAAKCHNRIPRHPCDSGTVMSHTHGTHTAPRIHEEVA